MTAMSRKNIIQPSIGVILSGCLFKRVTLPKLDDEVDDDKGNRSIEDALDGENDCGCNSF
jgi:hypothetical protein